MIRPAILTLLLVALLLPAAQASVDPHPRSPDLTMAGPVTALGLAASAGWVAAGIADPSGGLGGSDPHANVWTLWDDSGGLERTDDADVANCATSALQACQADVVALALSDSGTRLAIVAQDRGQQTGRVVFATANQGIVSRQEISGETLTSVAMTGDGQRIAVGSSIGNGVQAASGAVRMFSWSPGTTTNPGTVAPVWRTNVTEAVTRVAVGDSGSGTRVAAAGTGSHYRFSATGVAARDDVANTVLSVAFASSSADHWSVAGTSDGGVRLYADGSDSSTFAPALDLQCDPSAQNAVAIASDGHFFLAGGADGKVCLFRNPDLTGQNAKVLTTAALDGAVSSLALSGDDRYLAVGAGKGVYLDRASSDGLDPVWASLGSAPVTAVAVSQDGGLVASASGSSVTVFTTVHSVAIAVPDLTMLAPGAATNLSLQVRNDGNREEPVTLDLSLPADWAGVLNATSLVLQPGATVPVQLTLTPPAFAAPGTADVRVVQHVQGIPTQVAVPVQVAAQHLWTLQTDDAPNRDILAGGSVSFLVAVQNLGNGADTTNLTLHLDDPTWSAKVEPGKLTLPAGGHGSATVTLSAPSTAGNLASAHVTVGSDADLSASLRLGATVGARFGVAAAWSGALELAPGQKGTAILHVTNSGNAVDSYTLGGTNLPAGWTLEFPDGRGRIDALAAGASTDLPIGVAVPAGETPGSHAVLLTVTSLADANQRVSAPLTVTVTGASHSSTSTSHSKGTPGLGMVPLLALVALAAAVSRRSR